MRGDDLTAPLGSNKRRIRHLPMGLIGAAIITLVATTGLIWVGVVENPLGGEPTASIELASGVEGIAQKDIGINLPSGNSEAAATVTTGPDFKAIAIQSIEPPAQTLRSGDNSDVMNPGEPLKALLEGTRYGQAPTIAPNGLRPLDAYSSPMSSEQLSQVRIAVVINGYGLVSEMSSKALSELPSEFTFALSPYSESARDWAQQARIKGHELLLQVPMEPFGFPDNDAGPQSLMARLSEAENTDRLLWTLSQASNYVGVVNLMGERFTSDEANVEPLLTSVRDRGLMYLDDGTSPLSKTALLAQSLKVPFTKADLVIDATLTEEDIGAQLLQLESLARSRGIAVGTATAFPVTLRELASWSKRLEERGIVLVPISGALASTNG
ncbi:divergent polysaccharide deacetylase family protein [Rhodobacteraceae bacterium RKSG542]|uniref:divergent polysaccharide deacetylase family protein n=1 Tax=Pseudovibrio flavus TaxID=2529854 RepID=UPI0012BCE86B|nr:divergent polysaccharide deacetylase family protein [Pseudovibrio flavus]MTI17768.1 divergent polysaccharide deacetylase family protein [Pseudovibrio flavus]